MNIIDIESGKHDFSINLATPRSRRTTNTNVNYSDSDSDSDFDVESDEANGNKNIQVKLGTRVTLSDPNDIELERRSDAGSVHLNEYDLRLSEKYLCNENNANKIKLKYLFPTLNYKKLKINKIMSLVDGQFEKDIVTILSNHLDIIASYLSCQKILYMEASHYTTYWLNALMIPTIVITSTCSVLSGTNVYDFSILISGLTAFSSLLLAIINYLKLDAASEAHKISSHQYDKLQSQTEFLSGNTLLFSTSSFNGHTIANRKKQNIAHNLATIREKQNKIFDEIDEEYDKKMRDDNLNIMVNKRLDDIKRANMNVANGVNVANVALPPQPPSQPTTDVATPVSLTTLWSKIESELKLELLNEKRNKKDEATNRLRNELKHLNSEYDYSFADEEMSNHNEIIVKIRSEMENIKNKIKDIKETNQFVIPRDIRYRFPIVYNTNVFTWIKTIEEYKMYLANQLLDIKNNLNYLNRCINFSIEKHNIEMSKRSMTAGDNYTSTINIENINNVLQKLRKKRRYFKGLKRMVNSKLINLGTAFKDVDNMFKQEILNAENKIKFRFRIFALTCAINLLYIFFNIFCCFSKLVWKVDELPSILYLKRCKQKYIKDGINTDSVLYEILKSRDGNINEIFSSANSDLGGHGGAGAGAGSRSRSIFGICGIGGDGGIWNNDDSRDDDTCKPNYDSDDSDAKLSDWDC